MCSCRAVVGAGSTRQQLTGFYTSATRAVVVFFNKLESKVVILLINGECVLNQLLATSFSSLATALTYLSGEIIVLQMRSVFIVTINAIVFCKSHTQSFGLYGQATKCRRWMPRQLEAMKDVGACEKVRGAGKHALILTCPNGETHLPSGRYRYLNP